MDTRFRENGLVERSWARRTSLWLESSNFIGRYALQRTIGVKEHLAKAVNAFVELVISHGRVVKPKLVRNDETGLRATGDDQVAQVPIVGLDVALARSELQSLFKELA